MKVYLDSSVGPKKLEVFFLLECQFATSDSVICIFSFSCTVLCMDTDLKVWLRN